MNYLRLAAALDRAMTQDASVHEDQNFVPYHAIEVIFTHQNKRSKAATFIWM